MDALKWAVIIAKVILLIAEGMSKAAAVTEASRLFGVLESSIWKRGGF